MFQVRKKQMELSASVMASAGGGLGGGRSHPMTTWKHFWTCIVIRLSFSHTWSVSKSSIWIWLETFVFWTKNCQKLWKLSKFCPLSRTAKFRFHDFYQVWLAASWAVWLDNGIKIALFVTQFIILKCRFQNSPKIT